MIKNKKEIILAYWVHETNMVGKIILFMDGLFSILGMFPQGSQQFCSFYIKVSSCALNLNSILFLYDYVFGSVNNLLVKLTYLYPRLHWVQGYNTDMMQYEYVDVTNFEIFFDMLWRW